MQFASFSRNAVAFFCLSFLVSTVVPAGAQSLSGSVSGVVADQISGLAIADANVELYSGDAIVGKTNTNSAGDYSFSSVKPGIYTVVARASGYTAGRSGEFSVLAQNDTKQPIVLTKSSGGDQNLRNIGTVSATTTSPLASTTSITRTVDPTVLRNENYLRFGDALRTLPGVNLQGLSSSVSDDLYVNIRGMGETETQSLLDGHPIGPQGVYGINSGGGSYTGAFNFADSPFFAMNKVQVTFGSGASGLYGTDTIGGTINMETLNPTPTRQFLIEQGVGTQSKLQSDFRATGTIGRLGYALAGSVQSTNGLYPPQIIPQTGRPNNNPNSNNNGACTSGNDLTSCNLALNTYRVSAVSVIKSGLAKFVYTLSPNTNVLVSWFGSGQYSDSTGNGDNDNVPYDTRLAQIIANNTPNCSLPTDKGGAQSGYTVITDQNPNACYSAQQWAANSYGPFGGGAGRNRGTSMFDYHARLQSVNKHSTLTADWFFDHYKFYKSSQEAAGLDPTGSFFQGTAYSQFYNSTGLLVSDDISNERSDIGFGYFTEHQQQTRLDFNTSGPNQFSYEQPQAFGYGSVFARLSYNFSPSFSAYSNLWLKNSNVTHATYFDPRVSLVYKPPANRDVVRLTYGRTHGIPAPEVLYSAPVINGNPSSLNPSCTPFNTIGSAGNPSVQPETANDVELGYAHRFRDDSSIQLNLYQTSVANQLFAAALPLTQYGSLFIDPTLLAGFAAKIASAGCAGVNPAVPSTAIPYLAISTTYNAANATYKGVELSGRLRFNRNVYADYAWDLQSAVQSGIAQHILQSNPFIINGAQIFGIPRVQATLGLDYSNPLGWEARIDGYWVGNNNVSERPPYAIWNGFVSKALGNRLSVKLGVWNIFNNATQNYGYFGHQVFIPENQFFHDANSIQQFLSTGSGEEFGLPGQSFLLTLSQSI